MRVVAAVIQQEDPVGVLMCLVCGTSRCHCDPRQSLKTSDREALRLLTGVRARAPSR